MSRWDDQFESHGVLAALANARTELDAASEELSDAEQTEIHARVGRVLDYTEARLKGADPDLVWPAALDAPMNSVNAIASSLQQFVDSPQQVFLDQASNQADALLPQVATGLVPRLGADETQDYQAAITRFRRSAGGHLRAIQSKTEEIGGKLTEIETTVGEQETKLQEQDARLDGVVAEYQAQFSEAQAQRQSEFTQALEEAKTELRTYVEESQKSTAQALTQAKEKADQRIEELDGLLAKAVKTVGVIGGTGMSGGYQIVADAEKKAADRWRLAAAFSLLAAIGATIFAVAHGVETGFAVDTFLAKWAISIPFAALAGYAAHESSKHRDQARINRQLELQLASLDAYLAPLEETEQNRVRSNLAERF
ncbi:MAG: hypothetical protein M3P18_23920, partial [Actinomycetota bacterium]|nr:hypothetical protein [Actinomycetota bacterium]